MLYYLLTRMVLMMRGSLSPAGPAWDVMVDMFFYREPGEAAPRAPRPRRPQRRMPPPLGACCWPPWLCRCSCRCTRLHLRAVR